MAHHESSLAPNALVCTALECQIAVKHAMENPCAEPELSPDEHPRVHNVFVNLHAPSVHATRRATILFPSVIPLCTHEFAAFAITDMPTCHVCVAGPMIDNWVPIVTEPEPGMTARAEICRGCVHESEYYERVELGGTIIRGEDTRGAYLREAMRAKMARITQRRNNQDRDGLKKKVLTVESLAARSKRRRTQRKALFKKFRAFFEGVSERKINILVDAYDNDYRGGEITETSAADLLIRVMTE